MRLLGLDFIGGGKCRVISDQWNLELEYDVNFGTIGGRCVGPVAAATAAFAQESFALRADLGCEVTEFRRATPAMGEFHPRRGFAQEGVKLQQHPIRIPSRSHGVRAEDQALDGHHFVELAAWPGEVVVSGRPVIVVAPRGVRMDFVETRIVLDAHHGAHGEGDRPGGGGRGWGWVGGGHAVAMG